jgi:hypothetical protein
LTGAGAAIGSGRADGRSQTTAAATGVTGNLAGQETGADSFAAASTATRDAPAVEAQVLLVQDETRAEGVAQKDALSRDKVAAAIAHLLLSRSDDRPITIALFGPWGSGKSTLINLVRQKLPEKFKYADFNAWQNERVDNVGAALAQCVVDALVGELGFCAQLRLALRMSLRRKMRLRKAFVQSVRWWKRWLYYALPLVGPVSLLLVCLGLLSVAYAAGALNLIAGAATVALSAVLSWAALHAVLSRWLLEFFKNAAKDRSDMLLLPDYGEKLGSAYEIARSLDDLCELTLRADEANPKQLLIVVDDLDRCGPSAIKHVFDAVRLVAGIRGVSVIVALDHRIAYSAVIKSFAEFATADREPSQVARDYLAKIFNGAVSIQDATGATIENFIRSHIYQHSETATSTPSAAGAKKPGTDTAEVSLPLEMHLFTQQAHDFSVTNPRDLWRLHQAWSLLKGIALPAHADQSVVRTWMRHMFFRERLLQGTNEQRRLTADFLRTRPAQVPVALTTLVHNIGAVAQELREDFEDRDAKVQCVLLPAAPDEPVKAPNGPAIS